jgi:hypothetical protein
LKQVYGSEELENDRVTTTIIKLGNIAIKTQWSGVKRGEFPITEWRTFPLEVPSDGFKHYILGRSLEEKNCDVVHLPVYVGEDICDSSMFEDLLDKPDQAEDLAMYPSLTISTKCHGNYGSNEGNDVQSIAVLPIWADKTSMILELDWFGEVSPECFVKASEKLSIEEGLQRFKELCRPYPLVNCSYHLYMTPVSLGTHILGEGRESPNKFWSKEWRFDTKEKLLDAINSISETLSNMDISNYGPDFPREEL